MVRKFVSANRGLHERRAFSILKKFFLSPFLSIIFASFWTTNGSRKFRDFLCQERVCFLQIQNGRYTCTCTSEIFSQEFYFLRYKTIWSRQVIHASVLLRAFNESVICFISDKELFKFHSTLIARTINWKPRLYVAETTADCCEVLRQPRVVRRLD